MRFKKSKEAEALGLLFYLENMEDKKTIASFDDFFLQNMNIGDLIKTKTKQVIGYNRRKTDSIDFDRGCRNLFIQDPEAFEEVVDLKTITETDCHWFRLIRENYKIMLETTTISDKFKLDRVKPMLARIEKILNEKRLIIPQLLDLEGRFFTKDEELKARGYPDEWIEKDLEGLVEGI